jgi:hypothetical protein
MKKGKIILSLNLIWNGCKVFIDFLYFSSILIFSRFRDAFTFLNDFNLNFSLALDKVFQNFLLKELGQYKLILKDFYKVITLFSLMIYILNFNLIWLKVFLSVKS